MVWLNRFADAAAKTDRFVRAAEHTALLGIGLMGEAGSILTELKKARREGEAYPANRSRMQEEIGDFLWYFIRLVSVVDRDLLAKLDAASAEFGGPPDSRPLPVFLELGAAVGDVLSLLSKTEPSAVEIRAFLLRIWNSLLAVSCEVHVPLEAAAEANIRKIESRWPRARVYSPLFDEEFPEEEQLPRRLAIEFRERSSGEQKVVMLRCNDINLGDRLTDNILRQDGYRYHDIFHFAHTVHLGWSPVVRALLRCKRKTSSRIDEGEDGARAAILEEAIAVVVFSRAKELNFFDGLDHVDYELLKTVSQFVQGYEVERVPFWQWEAAILDGYSAFRKLLSNHGGRVLLDLDKRQLTYIAPS